MLPTRRIERTFHLFSHPCVCLQFEDIGRPLMFDPFLSPPCAFRCHTLHCTTDISNSHPPAFPSVHPPHGKPPASNDQPPARSVHEVKSSEVQTVPRTLDIDYNADFSSAEVTSTIGNIPTPTRYEHRHDLQLKDCESTDEDEKSEDSSDEEMYSPRSQSKTRSRTAESRAKGKSPGHSVCSSSSCPLVADIKYAENCRPDEVQTPIHFKSEDDRKEFNNARER